MEYTDKTTGKTVKLAESPDEFIAIVDAGEEEALAPALGGGVFEVTSSTNQDGVVRLRVNREEEATIDVGGALDELKADDRVKAIVPALKDEQGAVKYALPGRVLVRFAAGAPNPEAALQKLRSNVITKYRTPGMFIAAIPDGMTIDAFLQRLNRQANVQFAEPVFYGFEDAEIQINVSTAAVEDGEAVPAALAWNLAVVGAPDAWQITKGDADIVVAIVDGRPDAAHPALAGKFFVPHGPELTFTANQTVSAHATNVCGLVAGEADGFSGIAPGVRVVPVVVNLQAQEYAARADAIHFLADAARQQQIGGQPFSRMVMSCSWQTSGDVIAIRTALEDAAAADVLMVFSAGNSNSSAAHFPSDYSTLAGLGNALLCVAATGPQDVRAAYSNFSPKVDVTAPGGDGLPFDLGDVQAPAPNGVFVNTAGTSIAVPHVAGIAALMLSFNPALTAPQLKTILRGTADDIGPLNPAFAGTLGSGRVSASAALHAVEQQSAAVDPGPAVAALVQDFAARLQSGTGWTLDSVQVTRAGRTAVIDV
jgi:subtilisin family serine protease